MGQRLGTSRSFEADCLRGGGCGKVGDGENGGGGLLAEGGTQGAI